MTRQEQLERLAAAWEKCGDGRTATCEPEVDGPRYAWLFFNDDRYVAALGSSEDNGWSFDTQDATDCLAILRDVKGESHDIHSWVVNDEPYMRVWRVKTLKGYDVGVHGAHSIISRVHAVTLALEGE